jgi:hypothetical protein
MTGARRLAVLLALALAALAAPAAHAAPLPEVLAKHGFGDRENSYAWAMAWFKGELYVGTGRNVMCVEAATSQFYFSFTSFYKTDPAPNVTCPADKFDMDLRAEIWRYTPAKDRWQMVYRAPADIRNPRAPGKFLARDIAYRGMKVVRDRRGRKALFISGVSANEYVPEVARRHPPRLLRTYDGERFHDISVPLIVNRSGDFPDRRPIGYRGLELWRNRLYVVASTALTGDGAVFEVRRPFRRKARFKQVTPTDMHVFELQRFDGDLYVGTGSFEDGYGVYRTREPARRYRFDPVVTGGAGMGGKMVSVVAMHPFRGRLYVGGVSWYSAELRELPASELIRIDRAGRWEVVTGDPRPGPDGRIRNPISGLPAGYANIFNSHLWRMVERGGALYVGTLDWSWLLQEPESWAGEWSGLVDQALTGEVGFDLWASCNGVDWLPLTRTAFDEDPYDFGVRSLVNTPRAMYVGTANHAFGTRIWDERRTLCAAPGETSGARAARGPRQLLTDVQRDGTVLSWEGSPGAPRYRVERAAYVETPATFRFPPGPPGGGADPIASLPRPVPPGTPGGVGVRLPLREPFATVGRTTGRWFVDTTRRPGTRYAYQVVAEGPGRDASPPSNLQVVPDPRPPATWAQLARLAPRARAAAAIARSDRAAGRHALARLARSAGDDRVRRLALRLERRLRYRDAAGGSPGGR